MWLLFRLRLLESLFYSCSLFIPIRYIKKFQQNLLSFICTDKFFLAEIKTNKFFLVRNKMGFKTNVSLVST